MLKLFVEGLKGAIIKILKCAITTSLKQMENRKPQKRSRSYKEEPKENFRIEKIQ